MRSANGAWSGDEEGSTAGSASATTHGAFPGPLTADDFTVVPAPADSDDVGSITVTWNQPALTGGSDITSYDVSIWDNANRRWVDEANVAAVDGKTTDYTYVDRGLARGTTYYYRVRARNSQGAGPYTAYKPGPVPVAVPDAPELTVTPIGTGSIRLTWNVPADNGTPILGYVLERWVPW